MAPPDACEGPNVAAPRKAGAWGVAVRGGCSFGAKAAAARGAGFAGLVLVDSGDSGLVPALGPGHGHGAACAACAALPVVMLTHAAGANLDLERARCAALDEGRGEGAPPVRIRVSIGT
jgi:hypothetical protein